MRILFLTSGGGGHLAFLWSALEQRYFDDCEIVGCIADRNSKSLDWAQKVGLPYQMVNYASNDEQALVDSISHYGADLIVTTFHKILGPLALATFNNQLINLHYSLLPLFPGSIGVKPVEAALAAGCQWIGTTVHMVNDLVDGGPIISQSICPTLKNATLTEQMDIVFQAGCLNLLNSLELVRSKIAKDKPFQYNTILVAPSALREDLHFPDTFWQTLKASLQ